MAWHGHPNAQAKAYATSVSGLQGCWVYLTPILQAKRQLQLHSCKRRPKSHWRICSQGVVGPSRVVPFYHHRSGFESWWRESIWWLKEPGFSWIFFWPAKHTMKSQSATDRIQPFWKGHDAGMRPEEQGYQQAQNRNTAVKGNPSSPKERITSQQLPFMLCWLYDSVPFNSPFNI